MKRVEESRRIVERRLVEIRRAADRDLGRVPVSARWTLPLAALSVGLLCAHRLTKRRRNRQKAL